MIDENKVSKTPQINTNLRLFDLVRVMRSELHEQNLISDDEYAWLCGSEMATNPNGGSPSPRRLEDYDQLRKQLSDEQAKVKDLSDVLREYLSRCPDCGGSGSFPVQSGGESDAEAYQQQCQWCDSGLITLSQAEAMKGKQE